MHMYSLVFRVRVLFQAERTLQSLELIIMAGSLHRPFFKSIENDGTVNTTIGGGSAFNTVALTGIRWPASFLVGGKLRRLDKEGYHRTRVALSPQELSIVSEVTSAQRHDQWLAKVQTETNREPVSNATAMEADEGYRELGERLRKEAGCDQDRSWRIKQYVRDLWVSERRL